MTDPVDYINLERLQHIRTNMEEISISDLLDVLEYDLRNLTRKYGVGFDPDDIQQLLDVKRAIKNKLVVTVEKKIKHPTLTKCIFCSKEFKSSPSHIRKYCSKKCYFIKRNV